MEPAEKEEAFFFFENGLMVRQRGYYIYYEKNPEMQNYMISSRKENKITPSESITDRAAKDFRSIVKAKLEKADQKQNNRFLYAASTFLLIVILIIGVTMVIFSPLGHIRFKKGLWVFRHENLKSSFRLNFLFRKGCL